MASLKTIRKRIGSVKSTQQITKAMKMVAAAKLRRAQEAATQARPYADKLGTLLRNVGARVGAESHPLLAVREDERRIVLVLVTSDRGLCGGYNTNLVRAAQNFLNEHRDREVRVVFVGRKGNDYFRRRGVEAKERHVNLGAGPSFELASDLGARLSAEFAGDELDSVYLLYSSFRSALSQVPTVERLLPVAAVGGGEDAGGVGADYLYEPDPEALLDRLIKQYVTTLVHRAFLESVASEHGARMTAMDSATSNASEMINRLTLEMNRARQAAITKELMEIVGGAEALKG
jgi:F-type H+-transporting ATPase subunit gamma